MKKGTKIYVIAENGKQYSIKTKKGISIIKDLEEKGKDTKYIVKFDKKKQTKETNTKEINHINTKELDHMNTKELDHLNTKELDHMNTKELNHINTKELDHINTKELDHINTKELDHINTKEVIKKPTIKIKIISCVKPKSSRRSKINNLKRNFLISDLLRKIRFEILNM